MEPEEQTTAPVVPTVQEVETEALPDSQLPLPEGAEDQGQSNFAGEMNFDGAEPSPQVGFASNIAADSGKPEGAEFYHSGKIGDVGSFSVVGDMQDSGNAVVGAGASAEKKFFGFLTVQGDVNLKVKADLIAGAIEKLSTSKYALLASFARKLKEKYGK